MRINAPENVIVLPHSYRETNRMMLNEDSTDEGLQVTELASIRLDKSAAAIEQSRKYQQQHAQQIA